MLKGLLYFNPVAGRRPVSPPRLRTMLDLLLAQGIECEAVASKPRFQGPPELDLQAKSMLIAAGGDGTIHELLPLAVKHQVALGILPTGTANVLAEELGIPGRLDHAVRLLREGSRQRIALGRAESEYFHLMAAFTRPRSRSSVTVISMGAGCKITPRANPFSDRLEVCLFEGSRRADFTRYVCGILTGRHLSFPDVKTFSTRKVEIQAPASVPVQLDGDVAWPTPRLFEIEKEALEVIMPG